MIRFHRIFELTTDVDARRFAEAADLFRSAFPHEQPTHRPHRAAAAPPAEPRLRPDPPGLRPTRAHRVTGLAFVYYFADLRYGYLQYIASDPRKPARGIGAALYEALRELLAARGARGLFLDVPPADPSKLKDPTPSRDQPQAAALSMPATAFTRSQGTLWDVDAQPAQ